ncbi:hypothetical protein [Dongia sp.]|uniref:SLOG domain-containing protein n=1 Tax=Dongia sp. TaxID=1977262 RepID=UPI0035AF6AC8
MTAPIFLSASEPDPRRNPEYWDSRNLLNVREAVRAFCGHVLPRFPVVFGGHPAVTPLVKNIAARIAHDAQMGAREAKAPAPPRVLTFQSGAFVDRESSVEEVITPAVDGSGRETMHGTGMRNESLLLMRYEMLGSQRASAFPINPGIERYIWILERKADGFGAQRSRRLGTEEFTAAVFIGGMEGVVREFRIFRSFHPNTPAFPIATTGSACVGLLNAVRENLFPPLWEQLREETAYSLLMQKILPPDIATGKQQLWRGEEWSSVTIEDHIDPPEMNRSIGK